MTDYRFLQPLDVLYLRGNKLFDGAGAYAAAQMPPWPSLAAGALRSRMLVDAGVDLPAFQRGCAASDERVGTVLGTPAAPGSFRVAQFTLARRTGDRFEVCLPLPADVFVAAPDLSDAAYLQPTAPPACIGSSASSHRLPVLRRRGQEKPQHGVWLNGTGLARYVNGERLRETDLIRATDLWHTDPRLGIALDADRRSAREGMLYTSDAVALRRAGAEQDHDCGFLVAVQGADGLLPSDGLLRLGGDGRAASVEPCEPDWPQADGPRIRREGRFRLVLTTPAILPGGWRLPGLDADDRLRGPDGLDARLVAAAVPRAEVVSGWDLARWKPKPAQRVAPTGSVYWFEDLHDPNDILGKLAVQGLWPLLADNAIDPSRKAEGFNNVLVAAWPRRA